MVVYHDGTGDEWVRILLEKLQNVKMVRVPREWPAEAMVLARFLAIGDSEYAKNAVVMIDADVIFSDQQFQAVEAWQNSRETFACVEYDPFVEVDGRPPLQWCASLFCAGPGRDVHEISESLKSYVQDARNLVEWHRDEFWLQSVLAGKTVHSLRLGDVSNRGSGKKKKVLKEMVHVRRKRKRGSCMALILFVFVCVWVCVLV